MVTVDLDALLNRLRIPAPEGLRLPAKFSAPPEDEDDAQRRRLDEEPDEDLEADPDNGRDRGDGGDEIRLNERQQDGNQNASRRLYTCGFYTLSNPVNAKWTCQSTSLSLEEIANRRGAPKPTQPPAEGSDAYQKIQRQAAQALAVLLQKKILPGSVKILLNISMPNFLSFLVTLQDSGDVEEDKSCKTIPMPNGGTKTVCEETQEESKVKDSPQGRPGDGEDNEPGDVVDAVDDREEEGDEDDIRLDPPRRDIELGFGRPVAAYAGTTAVVAEPVQQVAVLGPAAGVLGLSGDLNPPQNQSDQMPGGIPGSNLLNSEYRRIGYQGEGYKYDGSQQKWVEASTALYKYRAAMYLRDGHVIALLQYAVDQDDGLNSTPVDSAKLLIYGPMPDPNIRFDEGRQVPIGTVQLRPAPGNNNLLTAEFSIGETGGYQIVLKTEYSNNRRYTISRQTISNIQSCQPVTTEGVQFCSPIRLDSLSGGNRATDETAEPPVRLAARSTEARRDVASDASSALAQAVPAITTLSASSPEQSITTQPPTPSIVASGAEAGTSAAESSDTGSSSSFAAMPREGSTQEPIANVANVVAETAQSAVSGIAQAGLAGASAKAAEVVAQLAIGNTSDAAPTPEAERSIFSLFVNDGDQIINLPNSNIFSRAGHRVTAFAMDIIQQVERNGRISEITVRVSAHAGGRKIPVGEVRVSSDNSTSLVRGSRPVQAPLVVGAPGIGRRDELHLTGLGLERRLINGRQVSTPVPQFGGGVIAMSDPAPAPAPIETVAAIAAGSSASSGQTASSSTTAQATEADTETQTNAVAATGAGDGTGTTIRKSP